MFNHNYSLPASKSFPLTIRNCLLAISMVLITTSYGCNKNTQKEIELEIKSVQPVQSNGLYRVEGTTNLPNTSRVAVSAVRYLAKPENNQANISGMELRSNRSILARQIVEVKDGKWEADLNLWQVAPDGSYQEFWQQSQSQTQLIPENEVTFIATFDQMSQEVKDQPTNSVGVNPESNESIQANTNIPQIEGPRLRFTGDGERYVQATQTAAVSIPTGKTVPPGIKPEDQNGGWGDRSQVTSLPASGGAPVAPVQSALTNRPIQVSELLR